MEALELAPALVGRHDEFETLKGHLREAIEGTGRTVLISGEAGIGKTRLSQELMKYAKTLKIEVLYGRSIPHDLTPYLVFRDAFEDLSEVDSTNAPAMRELGIVKWLKGSAPAEREAEVDPRFKRERLFDSVSQSLLSAARRRPVLMVLDDLQWADLSSLGLLHYLARRVRSARTLIIGTFRTEELKDSLEMQAPFLEVLHLMRREDLIEEVSLNRLTAKEVAELLDAALDGAPPSGLDETIFDETEGNPLFIMEVLKLLFQERLLVKKEGSWAITRPIDKLGIPEKVHEVIVRRFERIPTAEREVLECASVLGDQFDSHLLQDVLQTPRTNLLKILNNLVKLGLVHYAKGHYSFDHSKIREVLYVELGQELRQHYHLEAAQNLERLLDTSYSVIGTHYMRAGSNVKALQFFRLAAGDAKSKYALDEGIYYLKQALEIAETEHLTSQKSQILEELGDVYELVGNSKEALETWNRVFACHKASGQYTAENIARLHRKRASAFQSRGESSAARLEVEAGLRLLGEHPTIELGWLYLVMSRIAVQLEEWPDARASGQQALQIFRSLHDSFGELQALRELGRAETSWLSGDSSAAERYLLEALESGSNTASIEFKVGVHTTLAHLYAYRIGNLGKSMDHIAEIERVPDALRDPHRRLSFLMLKGWIHLKVQGNHEIAEGNFMEAIALARKIEATGTLAAAKYGISQVLHCRGQIDEAREGYEQFASYAKRQGSIGFAVESLCLAAECCLQKSDIEGFRRIMTSLDAPDLADGAQTRLCMSKPLQALGVLIDGDRRKAYATLNEAVSIAEKEADVELAAFAHSICAQGLLLLKKEKEAEIQVEHARQLLESLGRNGVLSSLLLRGTLLLRALEHVSTDSQHIT